MIPITPEMIGPGIDEECQDALIRINQLLEILKDYPYDKMYKLQMPPEARGRLLLA
jgi:hypothetical protein